MITWLLDHLKNPWVIVGFAGQILFMMRFIVQWISSEKTGRSTIPLAFWFFSLGGGSVLFIYALYQGDPVFIMGQGLGLIIYIRNLVLIYKNRGRDKNAELREAKIVLTQLEQDLAENPLLQAQVQKAKALLPEKVT